MPPKTLYALYAVLIFLFPLGLYLLVLAYLNRSRRPVLVSGVWDGVGLLFGLSGVLLYTVPSLIAELYQRSVVGEDATFAAIWARWWLVWLAYFAALVAGATLVLASRRNKTSIFNVDAERFPDALAAALAAAGLRGAAGPGGRLVIGPLAPPADPDLPPGAFTDKPPPPPLAAPYAELDIDAVPSLCHMTLHWFEAAPGVRRAVETQLARTLEAAVPAENPAAGWFLSFSGLIFGFITILTALVLLLGLFRRVM